MIVADPGYEPRHDAFDYDRHARSIAAGDGYPESNYVPDGGPSALRTPAYPYLLGAVYAVAGDDPEAGRLAGAVLGAVAVALVYLIACWTWGRRVGAVAGALVAVYPPLVLMSSELFAESLFVCCVLAITACLLAFRRSGGSLRWAAGAGALCGLASLTIKSGAVLTLPAALAVWTLRPRLSASALAAPATVALCAALALVPWTLRNAVEFGRLIPVSTSTGFALAGTYNQTSRDDELHPAAWRTPVIVPEYRPLFTTPGIDEGTLDATLRREATEFALDHPGYVAEVTARNLLRLFLISSDSVVAFNENVEQTGIGNRSSPAESAGFAVAVALALIGLVAIALPRLRRNGDDQTQMGRIPTGPWFLWLIPVVLIAVAAPVAGLPRYRLPADPFLLMLAAVGTVWVWDRLAPRVCGRRGLTVLASLLAAAVMAFGGCGGDDASETTAEPSAVAVDREYAAKANRICRDALAETEQLGTESLNDVVAAGGGSLEATTEGLVAPGLEIRVRQAARLRRLGSPQTGAETARRYIELFAPTEELIRQRLRAGRAGDIAGAAALETLLLELGREQQQAARRAGLEDCAGNFVITALKPQP